MMGRTKDSVEGDWCKRRDAVKRRKLRDTDDIAGHEQFQYLLIPADKDRSCSVHRQLTKKFVRCVASVVPMVQAVKLLALCLGSEAGDRLVISIDCRDRDRVTWEPAGTGRFRVGLLHLSEHTPRRLLQ